MTNEELKKLENDLWASANRLRATGGIKYCINWFVFLGTL